jgi:hypothetical protein
MPFLSHLVEHTVAAVLIIYVLYIRALANLTQEDQVCLYVTPLAHH